MTSFDPEKGIAALIGMDVTMDEPGVAVTTLTVTESLYSRAGAVHGGILSTLLDTAMGGALMSTLDDGWGCATVDMNIRFLRPVREGTLTATGTIVHAGARIPHLKAEVRDDKQKLVATATASFVTIAPPE